MSTFGLNQGLYINVTPRGAYYAVQDNAIDPTRIILTLLLQQEETPFLTKDVVEEITGMESEEH